jgi:hypothetical protein
MRVWRRNVRDWTGGERPRDVVNGDRIDKKKKKGHDSP